MTLPDPAVVREAIRAGLVPLTDATRFAVFACASCHRLYGRKHCAGLAGNIPSPVCGQCASGIEPKEYPPYNPEEKQGAD